MPTAECGQASSQNGHCAIQRVALTRAMAIISMVDVSAVKAQWLKQSISQLCIWLSLKAGGLVFVLPQSWHAQMQLLPVMR